MPIILLVKSDGTVEPLRSAGDGKALVMDPKVGSLVSYEGTTTANGAPGGTTLVCSDLTTKPDYDGNLVIITSGDYAGQARDINGATTGGTVTPDIAFGGQIVSGVTFTIVGIRTVPAEVAALAADVGDASTSTLGSLYAILGNPAQTFLAMIGYEGATALANKLTATRAALLDEITAGRMSELDAGNIPADIDTLLTRLSAVRAGYLDNLSAGAVALASVCTAARLGELDAANIPADIDTLLSRVTAAVALASVCTEARLAELDAANIPTDLATITAYVDELETRLTAVRAGYLDELGPTNVPADIDTLLSRVTAAVALASVCTEARLAELDAANIPADTHPRVMGRTQIFERSVTSAANAGDVIVATVFTQPCLIESIVIYADAAQTADMTSCGIFGGAGKVITFISAADAVQANLNAADKQVAWTGAVRLAATKEIVISLVGTGATAVDLTVTFTYRACVSGGYLA